MRDLPKIIWMLWLQGWDHAPRIVQACRRSWEVTNAGWTIRCLDRLSAAAFMDCGETHASLADPGLPPEACSDRVRMALLAQHGGVWADATVYCLRPLDDWLFNVLESGFFAFDRPARTVYYRPGSSLPDPTIISFEGGQKQRWNIGEPGAKGTITFGYITYLAGHIRRTRCFVRFTTRPLKCRLPALIITYRNTGNCGLRLPNTISK